MRAESLRFPVNSRPIEVDVLHAGMMGQIVPYVKDGMSRELFSAVRHNHAMDIWPKEEVFNERLGGRLRQLRKGRGWSQAEMAALLGVPHERYKKYETRSPIPAYLLPKLAHLSGRSLTYILTGRDEIATKAGASTLFNAATLTATFAVLLDSIGIDPVEDERAQKLAAQFPDALRRAEELRRQTGASLGQAPEEAARADGVDQPTA